MKLQVAAVGRPRAAWAKAAFEHYRKFLDKYGGAGFHFVSAVKIKGQDVGDRIRAGETERLLNILPERSKRIFIDQSGRAFDSTAWAKNLERALQESPGPVAFLIGGPLGLDLRKKRRSDEVWSLSALTFPHEMALIVLCEQLARGLSILRGDSYHH